MREPGAGHRCRAAWLRAAVAGVVTLAILVLLSAAIGWWAGPDPRVPDPRGLDAWLAALNGREEPNAVRLMGRRRPGIRAGRSPAAWEGFLTIAHAGSHTFWTESSGSTVVWVDGRRTVDDGGLRTSRLRRGQADLARGLHRIRVDHAGGEGDPFLRMAWVEPSGVIHHLDRPVPALRSEAPSSLELRRWAWRERVPRLLTFTLALGTLVLIIGCVPVAVLGAVRARCRYPVPRSLVLALVASSVLLVWSSDWGLAGDWAWAPDELWPVENVLAGLRQGFSGGWHHRYPPLQFYLLSPLAATLPLASWLGAGPAYSDEMVTMVYMAMRLVSVAMTLGTMVVLFWCGLKVHGKRRPAVLGAMVFVLSLQVLYYGKLTNVDGPALFWLMLSLLFFLRLLRRTTVTDAVWLGVTAAAAVGTKDMMAGFYLLVPIALVAREYRARRAYGRPASVGAVAVLPAYLAGAGAAMLVLLLVFDPVFNLAGIHEHVLNLVDSSSIVHSAFGPAEASSEGTSIQALRRYPRQWGLALLGPLAWYGGWPSLLLCGAGLVLVARRRRGRRALWLLVPAISYYVSVLSVLGKPDDRYLLGIWAIVAVFGGVAAGALLGRPVRLRVAGPVVVAGGMLYATLYSGTINVMMTRDARATAERFLQAEVSPFGSLGMIGLREYLPRVGGRRAVELEPTPESLEVHAPTFICLNVLHLTRYAHHPDWGPYLQELTAGRLGYEVVFDERSAPPWWALAGRLDIFADDEESRLTNLDKVGARIMILRRES